jgi:hypothetical protein
MNELAMANRAANWRRLTVMVLDSVSQSITGSAFRSQWSASGLLGRTTSLFAQSNHRVDPRRPAGGDVDPRKQLGIADRHKIQAVSPRNDLHAATYKFT